VVPRGEGRILPLTASVALSPEVPALLNRSERIDLAVQRGSGGSGASVAKRNIVVERNFLPGFSKVEGKFGLLGLSGKCCVSSVNASAF
jgi:hypothetical protein